jgi:serine/threonine protein kinase
MVGHRISHYRIDAELGRGGMGVVYRAHDEILRRDVALKVLSERVAGAGDSGSRILAEARAASSLNHPAIVTVYEVEEAEGNLFIVMELLAGQTLRARCGIAAFSPTRITPGITLRPRLPKWGDRGKP